MDHSKELHLAAAWWRPRLEASTHTLWGLRVKCMTNQAYNSAIRLPVFEQNKAPLTSKAHIPKE